MQQQTHICIDDINNLQDIICKVKFIIKPKKKTIRFADAPIGFFISKKGLCYKVGGLAAFICSTGNQFSCDENSLERIPLDDLANTLVYPCKCKIKVISDESGE